jgi:hypothetical protein
LAGEERTRKVTSSPAHADFAYLQNRMDLMYHALLVMFDGKPFFAPVKNPQRIVDMGTGTGMRILTFAIWKTAK